MVDILAASLYLKAIDVSRDPRNFMQIIAQLVIGKGFTGEHLLVNMPVCTYQHNKNGEPWLIMNKLIQLPPCQCGLTKLGWGHHNEHQQEMLISQRGTWKLRPLTVDNTKVNACTFLAHKLSEKEKREEEYKKNQAKKRENGNETATMKQWTAANDVHEARMEARLQHSAKEWDD